MLALAISVLWFLIALVVLVGIGWVVLWVLGQLGIVVPPMVIKLALIILGLLVLIYFLTMIAGGGVNIFQGGAGSHRVALPSPVQTVSITDFRYAA
jgi:hypothetical protein